GACGSSTVTETDTGGCARNQNGVTCSATTCGTYSACAGFVGTCGNAGTQTRQCTDHTCGSGVCNASAPRNETASCARNTNGVVCGTQNCGACTSCVPDCIREKDCTTPICSAGACTGIAYETLS